MSWGIAAAGVGACLALVILAGCATLRDSTSIFPNKELERMIAGRIDADYVGLTTCLAKCHKHDKITDDFKRSIHGTRTAAATGLPLVDCESCHGPGSLAIATIKEETCDNKTLLDIRALPAQAQSLICLKCHSANSLANLSRWNVSGHAMADVSCIDCHNLHKGPVQKIQESEINALCFTCHRETEAAFRLTSHHPVLEGKMTCYDCHDSHGTGQRDDLRGESARSLCVRCHAEKRGPFIFPHGDNMNQDCLVCHGPHGSINANLTLSAQPFLCLQCHTGHYDSHHQGLKDKPSKVAFFTSCTVCHSTIHGSNDAGPVPGKSGLIR
jgi:DmsE family decaheme c-type cytochrome